VADINGDGFPDLVTTNLVDGTVSILMNNPDGTFGPRQTYAVRNAPSAVVAGDFNVDGFNDLAVANANSNNLSVLINDGNWAGPGRGHRHVPVSVPKVSDLADGLAWAGFGQIFSVETDSSPGTAAHSTLSTDEVRNSAKDQAVVVVSISTGSDECKDAGHPSVSLHKYRHTPCNEFKKRATNR
jgi:hypothetical protein